MSGVLEEGLGELLLLDGVVGLRGEERLLDRTGMRAVSDLDLVGD